jgi:PD-(D/E)XK endonuclease
VETLAKGNTAEAVILSAFVERGFNVLVPFGEGQPYDLVVHLPAGEFLRVQCKTAREAPGCVVFNSRMTDHGRGRLTYRGLADVFGVYAPFNFAIYLVPVVEITGFEGRLRLQPTRNNQRLRVRYAQDFILDRWTADALAVVARDGQAVEPALVA